MTPAGEHIQAFHRWALLRYDLATGERDTSFGEGGVTFTSFGGFEDHPNALLLEPDGRLLVAGGHDRNGQFGYESDFALARYLPDLRIDPSYGGPCTWETEPALRVVP